MWGKIFADTIFGLFGERRIGPKFLRGATCEDPKINDSSNDPMLTEIFSKDLIASKYAIFTIPSS